MLALLLSALLHVPHGPEHWSADLRTAYLSTRKPSQNDRIAIIYVTEKSLEKFAYVSPTDRGLLADLVTAIDAAGPKVIGLDFIFDRPTDPPKDEALIAAIAKAKAAVVLGEIRPDAVGSASSQDFAAQFQERTKRPAGHLYFGEHHNPLIISDSVVRTTYENEHGGPPSFAEGIVRAAGINTKPISHYISWLRPPEDGSETFLTLNAETVLASAANPGAVPLSKLLKDRIVLVGGNFFDRDQHLTPFTVVTHSRSPGLFIHAQIIAQMIDGRTLTLPGPVWRFVLMVAAAAFGFWAGMRSGEAHLLYELGTVVALILVGLLAFRFGDVIFPYTGTLLAWLAGAAAGHYTAHNGEPQSDRAH